MSRQQRHVDSRKGTAHEITIDDGHADVYGHQHADECVETTDLNATDRVDITLNQVSDCFGSSSKVCRIEQTFADDVRRTDRAHVDNTGIVWKLFGQHYSDASIRWEDAQKILADPAIASAS